MLYHPLFCVGHFSENWGKGRRTVAQHIRLLEYPCVRVNARLVLFLHVRMSMIAMFGLLLIGVNKQVPGDAAIWSCQAGCHTAFHLICIQSWAKQEADRNAYRKVCSMMV